MKGICLTFDDGLRSHYDFVRPLLKENNIKGTFFICANNPWPINHALREELMTTKELKEMQDEGFELGNHTFSHPDLKKLDESQIKDQITKLNAFFERNKLKRPTSFCYPAYRASTEISQILKELKFSHARTGYIYDDHPWQHSKDVERPKLSYYPTNCDSSLLIKSTGIVNDVYGFEDFKLDVKGAPENSYCIFTFHGLKVENRINDFNKIVKYIKQNNFPTFNLSDIDVHE
tara:strand:- start:17 stop:715 length:699 start_codon:yes stop_codon:yes gene_type:complete